jgi:glycosyltransferase involved in cell wall biosynthesis
MKKILLVLLLFFGSLNAEETSPKVCLNMIIKNESKVIERCLASAKPLIDYWVIVDTGSSDHTQEIVKNFMKDIPGELHERPWVNFEHNRNEALSLAKDKADYLLFIDADDQFEIAPDFVMPKLDKDGYYLTINYSGSSYLRPQLVRNDLGWRWGGVVHEALFCDNAYNMGTLEGVSMLIIGGGDRSRDPKKFERDAKLLEKALKKNPSSTRDLFYLAQSYKDAGKLKAAIASYEKRVAMGGWDQEVFWSLYQIGIIQETLKKPEDVVNKSYSRAFQYRPVRAEPLYRLASYYRQKENYLMGYLLAQHALSIKQPNDPLFVETWIYDYGVLLEHSICAYWIGKYQEAFESSMKILTLKNLPDNIRECVNNNLRFITPKIAIEEHHFTLPLAG